MSRIADYLRSHLDKGTTQVALARSLGVSPGAIYKWLNTDTVPDTATLQKIAERTGKPISDFLDDDHGEGVPDDEAHLVRNYRKIKALDRKSADQVLDMVEIVLERAIRDKGAKRPTRKEGEH